jgi:cytosine/adenosine deaminase-related metal-dependent hydrolase
VSAALWSADWLITPEGVALARGAVLFDEERIVRVSEAETLVAAHPSLPRRHFPSAALVAGLVDSHAHCESACFIRSPEARDLYSLMKHVGDRRSASGRDVLVESQAKARTRAVESGVTKILDWVSPCLVGKTSATSVALEAVEIFSSGGFPERALGASAVAVAPHSIYMCAPDVLKRAQRWALKYRRLLTIHVAEVAGETAWLRGDGGPLVEHMRKRGRALPQACGPTVMAHLEACRVRELQRVILVHGVFLTDEELAQIAERGGTLCLCPRSNLRLVGETVDLERVVRSGVRFVLGTDSAYDQDVLADAKVLLARCPEEKRVEYACLLHSALTRDAAEAVGCPQTGRLAAGARADFAVFTIPETTADRLAMDWIQSSRVRLTAVSGRVLYEESGA